MAAKINSIYSILLHWNQIMSAGIALKYGLLKKI